MINSSKLFASEKDKSTSKKKTYESEVLIQHSVIFRTCNKIQKHEDTKPCLPRIQIIYFRTLCEINWQHLQTCIFTCFRQKCILEEPPLHFSSIWALAACFYMINLITLTATSGYNGQNFLCKGAFGLDSRIKNPFVFFLWPITSLT